jgi:quinol monooxygenase YgiN
MGRFVIVAYKPKSGKEQQLLAAVGKHLQVLQTEQLVTDKPPYVMRAGDGTIIEVFEWRSVEAIQQAHESPAVQTLWAEFAEACEYTPLSKLAEAQQMFAEFDAVKI